MTEIATTDIRIADDTAAMAQFAADWLCTRIGDARSLFRLALSGGATPRPLYRLLASDPYRARIEWQKLEIFWGDERLVPHDHPDSNYRMAREALLNHVPVPSNRIHPIPTDDRAEACAARYEATLKQCYGHNAFIASAPVFDTVLLGLGADGHTASLLPGQPVLDEHARWVAAVPEGRKEERITLTYPTITASRQVAFLVAGAEKAAAVAAVHAGDQRLPAARIRSQGEIVWFLDRAAAAALP